MNIAEDFIGKKITSVPEDLVETAKEYLKSIFNVCDMKVTDVYIDTDGDEYGCWNVVVSAFYGVDVITLDNICDELKIKTTQLNVGPSIFDNKLYFVITD